MILIALGSNLPSKYGSPAETLQEARRVLASRGFHILKASSTWRSPPFPVSDQPWFCNEVIAVEAAMSLPQILGVLKAIELDFGRVRGARNAARILDLDILAYRDEVYENKNLCVPHPRMHERGFVLLPLREVAPGWIHPILKTDVDALIKKLPKEQVEKLQAGECV